MARAIGIRSKLIPSSSKIKRRHATSHIPGQCCQAGLLWSGTTFPGSVESRHSRQTCDAIHAEYGAAELLVLPVNDIEEGYSYPARVRFELCEDNLDSYQQAADFLNFSNIDLVCLQHEYGIFGGTAGAHILELLRRLQMPVVTTR